MPPKKEKKEQFTGDQATQIILDYLVQQNRPYSAADISSNLHNAVTKVTATKLLKEMHEGGLIEGRISGKQVVYHAIQDPNNNASEEDLNAIDVEIQGIWDEATALKSQLKELQSSLNTLRAIPSMKALKDSIESAELEVAELEGKRAVLNESTKALIDPQKRAAEEAMYGKTQKIYYLRKRQFRDLWDAVVEAYDGNKEELWDDIGLDEI